MSAPAKHAQRSLYNGYQFRRTPYESCWGHWFRLNSSNTLKVRMLTLLTARLDVRCLVLGLTAHPPVRLDAMLYTVHPFDTLHTQKAETVVSGDVDLPTLHCGTIYAIFVKAFHDAGIVSRPTSAHHNRPRKSPRNVHSHDKPVRRSGSLALRQKHGRFQR